ncbi:hypothetical protein HMPREF0262_00554 [Clostridium sp. ATCC 29733]|nr:hypothetical protein HMPREF0262_00554 [Clostridium sp. ATCC 29733]
MPGFLSLFGGMSRAVLFIRFGSPPLRPPLRQKGRGERARARRRAAFPRPSPLFPLFGPRPTKCSPNWYFTAAKAGKCGILIPFKIVL